MNIPVDPPILATLSGMGVDIPDLENRLVSHGIGCFRAAGRAMLDICMSAGMGEHEYWEARAASAGATLAQRWDQPKPLIDALRRYDGRFHPGAAQEAIGAACKLQFAVDCGRADWSLPHSRDGIASTIKAAASSLGVQTGRRAFGNYKPVLVIPLGPDLSLVATLYWPGLSPMSPTAGLDWQFCLFKGSAGQASTVKVLNPPSIHRLQALGSVLIGHNHLLHHESSRQVYVLTQAMCILMAWFADTFSAATGRPAA